MRSGVYVIRNVRNGKRYIGSSVQLAIRWNTHRRQLENDCHHSITLQRAWNKYDTDAFVFEILLYCDPENCLIYEQVIMDYYEPEYNICLVAGSPLGVKHTVEARRNMSKAHLGIFGGDKNPFYGKRHSATAKQKMSTNRKRKAVGEKHPLSKLNAKDVGQIRTLLKDGVTQEQIAYQFDVAQTTISAIQNRKTWSHV